MASSLTCQSSRRNLLPKRGQLALICTKCLINPSRNAEGKRGSWCNPCQRKLVKKKTREENRRDRLKRYYNLTLEEVNERYEAQGKRCLICTEFMTQPEIGNTKRTLNIDHCHNTNKVRGIICSSCNVGLGNFGDNPGTLYRAYTYLKEHYDKNPTS